MVLLVDENVPASVSRFLTARGHEVRLVTEQLGAGTQDQIVALIGDRMSAIVVSHDHDFDSLASRIPKGNQTRFRKLGRISFRCREDKSKEKLEQWIDYVEFHYARCLARPDMRMFVEILDNGVKMF